MQHPKLFNKLFNTNGIEVSAFLDSVVNEYPYFGLAHFYTLKNTSSSASKYNETAAKTNLFFNSSFFLNKALLAKETTEDIITQKIIEKEHFTEDVIVDFKADSIVLNKELATEQLESVHEETVVENTTDISSEHTLTEKNELQNDEPDKVLKNEPPLLFEPLHASDYFASQGIKLSADTMANDKLGKQLKSFTAWLKTMKKVHPDKLSVLGTSTETAVQNLAEKSNIEEVVVTEPMAEAYILQNKPAKAIEIYSKLSLLNPAKSAYFAAKIDSLKK